MKPVSELRQDLVTGDWVVVAAGRTRRPHDFARRITRERTEPRRACPFERLLPTALVAYDRAGEELPARFVGTSAELTSGRLTAKDRRYLAARWSAQAVPNKYPAFGPVGSNHERKIGPYRWQHGAGFHEVIVTRDHNRTIADMSAEEVAIIIRAYRGRYISLKDKERVKYISIFHNHGRGAGASVHHPHSQIIAIPVIPPDIGRSLAGSARYFKKYGRCVHCAMLAFEKRDRRRIVFRNRDFIVVCPFVSRQAFEIRIFPARHNPAMEAMNEREIAAAAEALRSALAKLSRGLKNPDYNFFIHTAPVSGGVSYRHYHWHIEIVPKTAIWAGFEIGTGIEISTISPESAARFLREVKA